MYYHRLIIMVFLMGKKLEEGSSILMPDFLDFLSLAHNLNLSTYSSNLKIATDSKHSEKL